jgi:pyruvate,water dikinase
MSAYVRWLDAGQQLEASEVGGKGASLSRLAAAGMPVPPGFALTVHAYRRFHEETGLDEVIGPLLELQGRVPPKQVQAAAAPVLERLSGAGLPGDVQAAIAEAYGQLETAASARATFAVRSSAVSEDSGGASFAGLYESYLNLQGHDTVTRAVRDCYCCLWAPRAAQYRAFKGIDQRSEAMAVVVMETVPAAISGVAFTLNPLTGATDEVVINAAWGLGEAIVAGKVTPDTIHTDRAGAIRKYDAGEKAIRVVTAPGGTREEPVPSSDIQRPTLDEAQVRHTVEVATAIEQLYGRPVDIEFAYDANGRFYLLQARPVTTR